MDHKLHAAAQALIDRWETPAWKDATATAEFIGGLRAAMAEEREEQFLWEREARRAWDADQHCQELRRVAVNIAGLRPGDAESLADAAGRIMALTSALAKLSGEPIAYLIRAKGQGKITIVPGLMFKTPDPARVAAKRMTNQWRTCTVVPVFAENDDG